MKLIKNVRFHIKISKKLIPIFALLLGIFAFLLGGQWKAYRRQAEITSFTKVIGVYDRAQKTHFFYFHTIGRTAEEIGYALPSNFIAYFNEDIPSEVKEEIGFAPTESSYKIAIRAHGAYDDYVWLLDSAMEPRLVSPDGK